MENSSEYGKKYSEIVEGYSEFYFKKDKIYLKHLTLNEQFKIYKNYDLIILNAKKRGIQSEKEKIEEAIKNKWWDSNKESEYQILIKTIENLKKTRDKLVYISQKKEIELQLKKIESRYLTYLKERKSLIGFTIEEYSSEKFFDQLVLDLSYKDQNLSVKYFENIDEYYDLEEEDINHIKLEFSKNSNYFSNENLKLISACGFFQNLIYLEYAPFNFWGKPVINCSKYQIDLLIYGKMIKKTIENYSQSGKTLSDHILSDPEKLVNWVDSQNGVSNPKNNSKMQNSKNAVSSLVGATKEDLDNLGVNIEKIKGKSLLQLAKEKGGTLEKYDYLRARENT